MDINLEKPYHSRKQHYCQFEDCTQKHYAKGLCANHYGCMLQGLGIWNPNNQLEIFNVGLLNNYQGENYNPEQDLLVEDFTRRLKAILRKHLSVRDRLILIRHFGLFGDTPESLSDIAYYACGNVSRERVRQLKQKALRKLKRQPELRELLTYFNR